MQFIGFIVHTEYKQKMEKKKIYYSVFFVSFHITNIVNNALILYL